MAVAIFQLVGEEFRTGESKNIGDYRIPWNRRERSTERMGRVKGTLSEFRPILIYTFSLSWLRLVRSVTGHEDSQLEGDFLFNLLILLIFSFPKKNYYFIDITLCGKVETSCVVLSGIK